MTGDEAAAPASGASFPELLAGLPAQARDAWQTGVQADLPVPPQGIQPWPRRVIIAGLGGSAIGGDVAATLARVGSTTPVEVVRNYRLPPLDAGTLVILSSFSGNTEETLEAFRAVASSEAAGIAVTTGGQLAEAAEAAGMSLIRYSWPGPPRTGFGYGVFVPIAILRRLGVITIDDRGVEAAFAQIERAVATWGPGNEGNEAREIARWLRGGLPAIVGPDVLAVAARRWADDLAENAKLMATSYSLPEFNHNQVEAAAGANGDTGTFRCVILDAPAVHPRARAHVEQTAAMMAEAGREVRVVNAGGDTALEAILAASLLGTWMSYYLSQLRGVEATPVPVMDELKRRLAGR